MAETGLPADPSRSPARNEQAVHALSEMLQELETGAHYWRGRRSWHRRYYEALSPVLGIPAASLAAAAGVSSLQNVSRTLVAILAAASTVLIAIQSFVNPQARARANRAQEARFAAIEMDAAFVRRVRLLSPDPLAASDDLARLQKAFAEAMAQDPTAAGT